MHKPLLYDCNAKCTSLPSVFDTPSSHSNFNSKSNPNLTSKFTKFNEIYHTCHLIAVPRRFVKKNFVFVVGRSSAAPMSSAAPVSSAAPKKKHLIEVAPFGRLDQMLRTIVYGGTHPTMTFGPPPLPGQRELKLLNDQKHDLKSWLTWPDLIFKDFWFHFQGFFGFQM